MEDRKATHHGHRTAATTIRRAPCTGQAHAHGSPGHVTPPSPQQHSEALAALILIPQTKAGSSKGVIRPKPPSEAAAVPAQMCPPTARSSARSPSCLHAGWLVKVGSRSRDVLMFFFGRKQGLSGWL